MKAVSPSEIKSIQDYEIDRPRMRERVMKIKAVRRIHLGDHLTFLFENRDTVIYQIQEMMRAEGMTKPAEIKRELEVYNELVAGDGELCATLLIEYTDPALRDAKLRELLGLENHIVLRIGEAGEARAVFDTRQLSEDRISSVHYLTFPLGPQLSAAFPMATKVELRCDHEKLSVSQLLSAEQHAALVQDLSS